MFQTVPVDAVLFYVTAGICGNGFQPVRGIGHGNAGANGPEHLNVVVAVAKRHAVGLVDAVKLQHLFHRDALAAVGRDDVHCAGPSIPASALQQLEEKLDALTENDVLILAGSIPSSMPQDTYERLLARLDGKGVRCVVDATRALLANVLPFHPFLIKPNDHELGELVGRELTGDAEITAAARTLQERGARNVLVSMAGDGALLVDEAGGVHRIGCPKGKVVNSVGAGDSMVAGFVAGYLKTGRYDEALRLGTACGSATAFSLGLAKRSEIETLLAAL